MRLSAWMKKVGPEVSRRVAERCGTTVNYFYQLNGGHSRAGLKLAKKIVCETRRETPDGFVTPHDLRDDAYPPGFEFPSEAEPAEPIAACAAGAP